MRTTYRTQILMTVALLAGSGIASAYSKPATTGPRSDAEIAHSIVHEVRMYPQYSIWDDINIQVSNGQATLTGAVNQPYKKGDIERLAQRVPGVTSVRSEIKVLPLSPFDDQIRVRVARAIYGSASLNRYGMQPLPPIHILVDNGHVTLAGVVANEMDKNVAGISASSASMSFGPVVNNLQVENPPAKR